MTVSVWQRNTIFQGDAKDVLARWPEGSVHCCVTSPPYWNLRDYGVAGQVGAEASPAEYVDSLVEIFRGVWRVLRGDGVLWLNLGDAYASSPKAKVTDRRRPHTAPRRLCPPGAKRKDLLGLPWMVAFALRADGWYLRSDIIWHKSNPMPESITDRPTRCHEYLFLLSKCPTYYYDAVAIAEPLTDSSLLRLQQDVANQAGSARAHGGDKHNGPMKTMGDPLVGRNKRDVWTISTGSFKGAHFAVFPPALVEPCILAGTSAKGCCSECGSPWRRVVQSVRVPTRPGLACKVDKTSLAYRDPARHITIRHTQNWEPICRCGSDETTPAVVLDPFAGSGTTALVARMHGRDFVGIEINPEYCEIARARVAGAQPPLLAG